jgi:hypothetical protein
MQRWIGDRKAALESAAGIRRYVIAGLISFAVAAFDYVRSATERRGMTALVGMPSWGVGVIVFLAIVSWWLLERLVTFERQIRGSRLDLAKLRVIGVAMRNEGLQLTGFEEGWTEWSARVEKWNTDVIANMRKLNEADAEWFSVLDVVPAPRLAPSRAGSPAHEKLFREHDFRLRRLGEMIYGVWTRIDTAK